MIFHNKYATEKREPLFTELGNCPCCHETVYDNHLYVEKPNGTYHFSCYNRMKQKQADKGGK